MDKAAIEALKASRPILQVLQDLGVQVQHNRFRCPMPDRHAHGDRTPSATVSPERGSFKCWVCPDVRGDVIDLVRLVKGCSFREALQFLGAPGEAPRGKAGLDHGRLPAGPGVGTGVGPDDNASGTAPIPDASAPGHLNPATPGAPAASASPPHHPRSDRHSLFNKDQLVLGLDPAVTKSDGPRIQPASASSSPPLPAPRASSEEMDANLRQDILAELLRLSVPVAGPVARYLQKRRIFKRTWDGQRLRMIGDYHGIGAALEKAFGREALQRAGFFNAAGHLRYYRHRLLFPYFDRNGKPVYLQARGIENDVKPKELSMAGPIPMPYNVRLLDGEPGQIYLCEGIIDTLTLLEQGFPAVGVPGAANFKPAWAALFKGKSVHVAFDPDAPGENGAARAIDLLKRGGIEARKFAPPPGLDLKDWFPQGLDLNDWFRTG
jgi:DNA primase